MIYTVGNTFGENLLFSFLKPKDDKVLTDKEFLSLQLKRKLHFEILSLVSYFIYHIYIHIYLAAVLAAGPQSFSSSHTYC